MTARGAIALLAVVCVAGGGGCEPRSGGRPEPATRSRAAARTTDAARAVTAAPGVPSFARDIAPVLRRRCASAPDCHGDQPTDSVALDLRPGAAYAQLVARPSHVRRGALLVARGDAGASFLVDKLTGALRPREGKPMPLDAETGAPIEPNPLAGEFIDRVLREWIAAGAPNN